MVQSTSRPYHAKSHTLQRPGNAGENRDSETTLRELESILRTVTSSLPALIKALPVLAAYVVLFKFTLSQIRDWRGNGMVGSELAYVLIGLSAILWALGR